MDCRVTPSGCAGFHGLGECEGPSFLPVRENSDSRITFGRAAAGPQEQRIDHRDIEGRKRLSGPRTPCAGPSGRARADTLGFPWPPGSTVTTSLLYVQQRVVLGVARVGRVSAVDLGQRALGQEVGRDGPANFMIDGFGVRRRGVQ